MSLVNATSYVNDINRTIFANTLTHFLSGNKNITESLIRNIGSVLISMCIYNMFIKIWVSRFCEQLRCNENTTSLIHDLTKLWTIFVITELLAGDPIQAIFVQCVIGGVAVSINHYLMKPLVNTHIKNERLKGGIHSITFNSLVMVFLHYLKGDKCNEIEFYINCIPKLFSFASFEWLN